MRLSPAACAVAFHAILLAFAAVPSRAELSATLRFTDLLPFAGVSGHAGTADFTDYGAGIYQFDVAAVAGAPANPFLTDPLRVFCVELAQPAPLDWATYTLVPLSEADRTPAPAGLGANVAPSGLGADRARRLQLLYGLVFGGAYTPLETLDTDAKRTGFQLAVWELSHDDDFNLTALAASPHFFVTAADAAALAQAQDWTAAIESRVLAGDFSRQMPLAALHHETFQDYVVPLAVGVVVPEPATWAAWFGAGALVFVTFRRRSGAVRRSAVRS